MSARNTAITNYLQTLWRRQTNRIIWLDTVAVAVNWWQIKALHKLSKKKDEKNAKAAVNRWSSINCNYEQDETSECWSIFCAIIFKETHTLNVNTFSSRILFALQKLTENKMPLSKNTSGPSEREKEKKKQLDFLWFQPIQSEHIIIRTFIQNSFSKRLNTIIYTTKGEEKMTHMILLLTSQTNHSLTN